MKYSYVSYDWKQGGSEEIWEEALKQFGLVLTPDPFLEGSDTYAFYITERKPTDAELREMMVIEWGEDAVADIESEE